MSNGTRGETQKEIIKMINEKDQVELNKINQELMNILNKEH